MGVPYETFWHLNPNKLRAFAKAYKLKLKRKDEELWLQGKYNFEALMVAFSHFGAGLNGKTSEAKYLDKPYSKFGEEYEGLTEEEIDNLEIQKMIQAEELWIANQKIKGMSETKIK